VSYQQDIRDVLQSKAAELNSQASFDVSVARPGSFEMKVTVTENSASHEKTFDLSNGLTPRTRRAIQEWVDLILNPTTNTSNKNSSVI
jgi:hypothetical protein